MGKNSQDLTRVIGFIDMDSFEVQIYLKHVYKSWEKFYYTLAIILADTYGERIISVNPIAKKMNITREDTVSHANRTCRNLLVMRKISHFNKPESKLLRHCSWAVLDSIVNYRNKRIRCSLVPLEHSPSDEFYLDLTEEVNRIEQNRVKLIYPAFILESNRRYKFSTCIPDWLAMGNFDLDFDQNQERRLLIGVKILDEISKEIFNKTSFDSSVGAAENKLLAKLACTLNKPNGRTALTHQGFDRIKTHTTIDKLKGLGGDLGEQVTDELKNGKPMTIQQLKGYKKWELKQTIGIDDYEARFVFDRVRGVCDEQVTEKLMTNFISAGKYNYRNPNLYIDNHQDVRDAFTDLCDEMSEKLNEDFGRHGRWAESIQVHIWINDKRSSKFYFAIDLENCRNSSRQVCNDRLLIRTYRQFKQTFNGWRGHVGGIRLSAKPK